ncbi:cytochrome P450 [Actinoplanes sp. NBRC 101535]|uniref:cytochrome P450 n=1 Tax=Actinoplanes sp. NBRC 101535 TaxID=3032196 RepID=UPI0024A2B120|nr:cytochrome P450 [Actinoplanes sp. NBRC 101535]GLY05485.1 hypothetical protein Acsp01_58640 [Actinoplanes sp. NBRC 101535]
MPSALAESYDPLGAHAADPYPFYAEARHKEPVFYSPRLDAYVLTRFAEIDAVLKNPAVFSSVNSLRGIKAPYPSTIAVLSRSYPQTPDAVTTDDPAHRRLRQPYTKHLTTTGRLKNLEPAIRTRAEALVDAFIDDGSADLVARFSAPLPVQTAAALFGFAPDDIPVVKEGSEAQFSLGSVDLTVEQELQIGETVVRFKNLVAEYVRRRHTAPAGDLISDVTAAFAPGVAPGEDLSYDQEAEVVTSLCSTFGASHITTADLIGSALRLLTAHPEQWELLLRDPSLIPQAVEETLRYEAPIPAMFRHATSDAVLAGVDIPAGADLMLLFASAGHDEDRYPEPARFDVTRRPARHLAFGAGIHTCVGAGPARAQARIALEVLTARLPGLSLAPGATVPIRNSVNVRGPLELALRW